jgi:DGQHR domain-containing protein
MPNAKKKTAPVIKRRATMLSQSKDNAVYQFSLTGKELLDIADISRISRDNSGKLIGYQRPEVRKHVQDIVKYLDEGNVLFPHPIILAFSSRVRFVKQRGPKSFDGVSYAGELQIPTDTGTSDIKAAWVVDGQQRLMAISKAKNQDVPIPVSAFITDDIETQRDQFLRINNSRPLPKGLVEELLPEVSMSISSRLAASKIPSSLVNYLNQEATSPFFEMIKRTSMTVEQKRNAVVSDGPLIKVIKESLTQPSGCLFPYRDVATGETETDTICKMLLVYWNGVKMTFPEAWGLPATRSRLMHGAGLWAAGRLMDRIIPRIDISNPNAAKAVAQELAYVKDVCRWTGGTWEELRIDWNEVQNVPRHVKALSNFLIRTYVRERNAK